MKIVVYCNNDISFDGERSPDDVRVTEVSDWESLLSLMAAPRPPYMEYPYGRAPDSREMLLWKQNVKRERVVVGPQMAVVAALASGVFTPGTVIGSGSKGDKDYGYYAVIED